MRNRRGRVCRPASAALWFWLTATAAGAQDLPYSGAYEALRDAAYDQRESAQAIEELYRAAVLAAAADAPAERLRRYRLSRVEYMAGRGEHAVGSIEAADRHYEASLAWARASLELGAYSEGHRMAAEAISQMCLTRGYAFALANGARVLRHAREALRLDGRSGRARIIVAASKIYPPAILGGDPREGLSILKLSLEMPDIEKEDLFNIYCGMGVGCARLRQGREAAVWLERAMELYPGNRFVRDQRERLR